MYLLDTSVCIGAMRGQRAITTRLAALDPRACAVSIITEVELRIGAALYRFPELAARQVTEFLAVLDVLHWAAGSVPAAVATALHLRRLGAPIGPFDLLIAATALAHDRLLITRDRDFLRVPGLRIEVWSV